MKGFALKLLLQYDYVKFLFLPLLPLEYFLIAVSEQ